MEKKEFLFYYKDLSDDALLDILDQPAAYQPQAVEAAREELKARQLSEGELEAAKKLQRERAQAKAIQERRAREVSQKVKAFGHSVTDTLSPVQAGRAPVQKQIRLISLFLIVLFLFQLYETQSLLLYMLTDEDAAWDLVTVLYFLPLAFLPATAGLMWLRKRWGWLLAAGCFAYGALNVVTNWLWELTRDNAGFEILKQMFPATPTGIYIMYLLVFGGLTWRMCQADLKAAYGITNKAMWATLTVAVGIALLVPLMSW